MAKQRKPKGTRPPDLYCMIHEAITKHAHKGSVSRHGWACELWRCVYCNRDKLLYVALEKS